ncbi:MAG: hypothetical protein Q9195_005711 [Heterodermia aff. obscurata]
MPSSQRDAPGDGFNDRVQRRPATTGKAASTAKPGLKARPSLSSITNRNEESRGASDETSNPTASGTGSRVSAAASKRSTSPTKASIGRRSILGSTVNVEKKAIANRPSTASPSKTPAKSTSHNARLSTTSSHRSTRPIHYSPQSIGRSGPPNKRLSAISASPTPVQQDTSTQDTSTPALVQLPNHAMTRKARPALGARKSTMSATIEQRLREWSVVSTMLRAAMADDGSSDDETKEEYGNQVDEDLAMLKEKLNKARRSEGREPLDAENGIDLPKSTEETEPVVEVTSLEKLAASEERTREIELEKELEAANARAGEAEKLVQELKRNSATQHEELKKELAAEASAASAASARGIRLLNDQLRGKKAEVDALTAKLASERAQGQEAASKARDLAYASLDLKNTIDDLQEKNSELLKRATYRDARFEEVINSKDLQIQQTCQNLEESLEHIADYKAKLLAAADREHSLNSEIHDLMLQVEQVQSSAEDRLSQSRKETTSYIQKITELEAQAAHDVGRCQQLSHDQLQELKQLKGVIEALQDRIQQIHEAKETELESQRLRLTQQHDDCMSKARETHEKDLQSEKENSREQLENLRARDQEIEDLLHMDYSDIMDSWSRRYDETERKLLESEPVLKEAQELLDLTRERCSKAESHLQAAVARENKKLDVITAKDAELAMVYQQSFAERASLLAAKEIVAAMNIELETVAIAHDEAMSAESSTSPPLADSVPPPSSSESTGPPFVDQIVDQIRTHNPHISTERLNAIAANLRSGFAMGRNAKLEASSKEIISMLHSDLKKLDARCRDLTNRFKSIESPEKKNADISNADISNAEMDRCLEEVRKLNAEKADLQERLTEAEKIAGHYQERLETARNGTGFRYVRFTKEAQREMREQRLQKDDGEDDQPRFEHVEYAGPSLVGNVAGMQEQLRQIENTNNNLIEDQQRWRSQLHGSPSPADSNTQDCAEDVESLQA